MNRILARTLAVTGTAAAILAVTTAAASAGEREQCSDIAVCTGDVVHVGDLDVHVLDGVHLLHAHH